MPVHHCSLEDIGCEEGQFRTQHDTVLIITPTQHPTRTIDYTQAEQRKIVDSARLTNAQAKMVGSVTAVEMVPKY